MATDQSRSCGMNHSLLFYDHKEPPLIPIPCLPIEGSLKAVHRGADEIAEGLVVLLDTSKEDPVEAIVNHWFLPDWSL